MDEFERRLKRDADEIRVEASPELRARIEASLHAVTPVRPVAARADATAGLWLASSLAGLAAAVIVIVLINWRSPEPVVVEPLARETVPETIPEYRGELFGRLPLSAESAVLTAPLEDELMKLKADVEKARESVKDDIDFTF